MNTISTGSPDELDLAQALRCYEQGRLEEARTRLSDLAVRFPDDDRVIGKLGYVEHELGNYEGARSLLQKATELDPKRELWSIGLFHALWRLGATSEAFAEARRYLNLHPSAPEYNRLVADLKRELDQEERKS